MSSTQSVISSHGISSHGISSHGMTDWVELEVSSRVMGWLIELNPRFHLESWEDWLSWTRGFISSHGEERKKIGLGAMLKLMPEYTRVKETMSASHPMTWDEILSLKSRSVLQCVAVCCSVLQYCSVLQCVAVCCSVLQYHLESWDFTWAHCKYSRWDQWDRSHSIYNEFHSISPFESCHTFNQSTWVMSQLRSGILRDGTVSIRHVQSWHSFNQSSCLVSQFQFVILSLWRHSFDQSSCVMSQFQSVISSDLTVSIRHRR